MRLVWRRLTTPRSWRRSTRRWFLVLLPITLPALIMALAITGAALAFRDMIRPLVRFWSDPPRHRQRYYVGGDAPTTVSTDYVARRSRHEFIRFFDLG